MASPMVSRVVARGVTGGHHIARIRVLPQLRDLVPLASSSSSSLPGSSASSACHFSSRTGGSEESQSQSPNETPSSSSIPTPQVVYKKVSETFRNAASSAGSALHKMREANVVDSVRTGYTFLKEEMSNTSPRRKQKPPADAPPENTTVNAIVPVAKKTSGWEKRWETLKEKAKSHPAFKRIKTVTDHPVVTKGQELAEDLRERWETSDSPVVHKIQDLNESLLVKLPLLQPCEKSVAMTHMDTGTGMEGDTIEKSFTYSGFLAEIQSDIRPTLRAYLKGDLATLKKKCSREVVERCQAERRALESQGIFLDNEILHISDVEIKETKLLGNSPIIIISFQTQQIHCARDKAGNIIEGARDDIHTIFYAWAMQLESPEEGSGGDFQTRWKLREMQQAGMQALI